MAVEQKKGDIRYLTPLNIDTSKQEKYCRFKKLGIKYIDHKDADFLLKFANEQGKLLPRRLTGTSLKFQRRVATAVRRARHLVLMPYIADLLKQYKEQRSIEIILKQDVHNLGPKDDVVTVKNGHGRNYLVPQGLTILATPSTKKVLAENLKQKALKEQHIIDEAKKTAKTLLALAVKIVAKVGIGDKLFDSINNGDVAQELTKTGHDIDRKFISIAGSTVKHTGEYNAAIRLHREVIIDFPFEVVAEVAKAEAKPAEKAKAPKAEVVAEEVAAQN